MKQLNIILTCSVLVFIISCKSKKVVDNGITVQVLYAEQHCGGAEISDEELEEMMSIRPYANNKVYIAKQTGPYQFEDEQVFRTDKAGMITAALDTGRYVVSFYQLIQLKPDNKTQESQPKMEDNPSEPDTQDDVEASKDDCEQRWKAMMAMPLRVVKGKSVYEVPLNKECNPCEPPKP